MHLFRTLSAAALLVAASGAITSCIQAPDYPDEPSINEKSITSFRKDNAIGLRDSVEIALNFEDGDGDLGLDANDKDGPYADNGGTNRYFNNYFVDVYYKNRSGVFVPLVSAVPGFGYNGRYPRLTEPDARPGALKGVLRYAIVFSLLDPATAAGTELQFRVSIADRALHESNVITTTSVVL